MQLKHKTAAHLLLVGSAIMTMGSIAIADEIVVEENTEIAKSVQLDTQIVTGTRQVERTIYDSLSPIDSFDQTILNQSSSEDLFDTMAQVSPSFKVERLPMADGNVFVRPGTIRGLSPAHTLVLVNGKRRHRSAYIDNSGWQAADLATIPSYAIKRIEVLRDGAAAQYGSDAISGVINIILDDDVTVRAFTQYGQYAEGDGENYRVGVKGGSELGDNGVVTGSFEYFNTDMTSRSRQRPDATAYQAENPDVKLENPVQNWGQPEREGFRLAVNSNYKFSDAVEGYAFGTFSSTEGWSDFNWRNPKYTIFNPTSAYPGFDLKDTYPGGFSPYFGQKDQDISLVAGAKGKLSKLLSWDLSMGYGNSQIEYNMKNSINASMGPDSPTSFYIGKLTQEEINANLDFVYKLDLGLAYKTNLAFGVEHRKETYTIDAGDPESYIVGDAAVEGIASGSNGYFGFSPLQAGEYTQDSNALYVDWELPMTDSLTTAIAGRFEDYSEFGSTFDTKLSARYEITSNFAVRATGSTGFRAPTPGLLFSERVSQGLDTNTLEVYTSGRYSPEGPIAGIISQRDGESIDSLKPEESTSFSTGFVYRNDVGFSATLDYYNISITDRISSSDNYTLTDEERTKLVALGVTGGESISSVSFLQNDYDTRTQGIDLVASQEFDLDGNLLNLTLAYNYNKTEIIGSKKEYDEATRVTFEESLPQHSGNLALNYSSRDFDFFSRIRYYGSWVDRSGNSDGDIIQEFGAETFVDLSLTWHANKNISMRVGAENVFNEYPDEATYQSNRGLIYSRNAPYDTDGAFYSARLDLAF